MFSNLPIGQLAPAKKIDPKDIPPPTPVVLPRYQPIAQDDASIDVADALPTLLRSIGRSMSSFLGPRGLSALGLNLELDVSPEELVPDPSFIPNFKSWEQLSPDEAQDLNQSTRIPIRNGNLSPGCQTYLERKKELSNTNEDGFRTVRRLPPPKGKQHARLGNAYEFFRCLENFTTYWDDPTQPADLPPSPEITPSEIKAEDEDVSKKADGGAKEVKVIRTNEGSAMPAEFRQQLLSAFIKLVAYDFGCNVSLARLEPRLHLSSSKGSPSSAPRKTYCASSCSFIYQSPTTRETARAGILYGPLGAVSSRPTVKFADADSVTVQSLDLAREVVAALITAQHRARENKTEVRFGEGEWWTTKPRWGGGSGGPIGREVDRDAIVGEKDAKPSDSEGMPIPKKPRKNMSVYDSYRMVRPPSSTWDKKMRYEAIGKVKGSTYDDVFVVSCLFHHISVLRVRVPNRLLEVLEGSPEPDLSKRSWGKLQAWRSKWYDLYVTDQRVAAMQLLWGVLAYQMRNDAGDADTAMSGV
ncbi:unnamed protein product [Clonostachys byssicola]|uniref:Uncharacterized protein n=1 Tax=Clonostachys byssicola TaxID=160290 RepID=A0A9N9UMJ3_9HYPO|nr:unnamed protein product [Clonostachys byssicola]